MYSIALCLDAPMQSWGTRSRGSIRDTAREPTKSGVVGLIAAALGVPRDESDCLAELSTLRMGVRVDREGILERDYHVTQNVPTTSGSGHRTALSHRYYLADAVFLVVLVGLLGGDRSAQTAARGRRRGADSALRASRRHRRVRGPSGHPRVRFDPGSGRQGDRRRGARR